MEGNLIPDYDINKLIDCIDWVIDWSIVWTHDN